MEPSKLTIPEAKEGIIGEVSQSEIEKQEDRRIIKSHLAILLAESEFLSFNRRTWSIFLLACVVVSISFQILLTIFVGLGWFSFIGYGSFLTVVAGGTFAQVVGLAAIALKWIFGGKRPDEMLENARLANLKD